MSLEYVVGASMMTATLTLKIESLDAVFWHVKTWLWYRGKSYDAKYLSIWSIRRLQHSTDKTLVLLILTILAQKFFYCLQLITNRYFRKKGDKKETATWPECFLQSKV
jgi:hypothetical protein